MHKWMFPIPSVTHINAKHAVSVVQHNRNHLGSAPHDENEEGPLCQPPNPEAEQKKTHFVHGAILGSHGGFNLSRAMACVVHEKIKALSNSATDMDVQAEKRCIAFFVKNH